MADKRTVLMAEDSGFYRRMLAFALEEDGFECIAVASGGDALDVLTSDRHLDLVILDLMMPEKNGFEILERLRQMESRATVPVLVVSQYSLNDIERGILEQHKIGAMLPKSMSIDRILSEVDALLHPEASELRRAPRIPSTLAVTVRRGTSSLLTTTFNLSENGMFLVASERQPPTPGEDVLLRFWIPGQETLFQLDAKVVWVNGGGAQSRRSHPAGFAVEYVAPQPATLDVLRGYLRSQSVVA